MILKEILIDHDTFYLCFLDHLSFLLLLIQNKKILLQESTFRSNLFPNKKAKKYF